MYSIKLLVSGTSVSYFPKLYPCIRSACLHPDLVSLHCPVGSDIDYVIRCWSRVVLLYVFWVQGVVDLVKNKAVTWDGEQLGASFSEGDIPADLVEKAAEYREKLIEAAVEQDDDALEQYLEVRIRRYHIWGHLAARCSSVCRARRPNASLGRSQSLVDVLMFHMDKHLDSNQY